MSKTWIFLLREVFSDEVPKEIVKNKKYFSSNVQNRFNGGDTYTNFSVCVFVNSIILLSTCVLLLFSCLVLNKFI